MTRLAEKNEPVKKTEKEQAGRKVGSHQEDSPDAKEASIRLCLKQEVANSIKC